MTTNSKVGKYKDKENKQKFSQTSVFTIKGVLT